MVAARDIEPLSLIPRHSYPQLARLCFHYSSYESPSEDDLHTSQAFLMFSECLTACGKLSDTPSVPFYLCRAPTSRSSATASGMHKQNGTTSSHFLFNRPRPSTLPMSPDTLHLPSRFQRNYEGQL